MSPRHLLAPAALMVAAIVWGVVWYPYRLLEEAGLSGSLASLLTYLAGLAWLLLLQPGGRARPRGNRGLLAAVALTAGWTNLAYVLAVIEGEIMRVLLLFYLAPLWTLLFARIFVHEHPGLRGWLVILLSLAGAGTMLHGPDSGLPIPVHVAEWLGLSAGITYALSNVLSRKLREESTLRRGVWIFAGVVLITLAPVAGEGGAGLAVLAGLSAFHWGLVLLTAGLLLLATLTVQYGLARMPANRAIVILLLELVAAAYFSWLWAGESMTAREWAGGALIVAAALLSGGKNGKGDRHA